MDFYGAVLPVGLTLLCLLWCYRFAPWVGARGAGILLLVYGFMTLAAPSPLHAQQRLRLATTTSTDNSGLLQVLLPPFESRFQVEVGVIAVGTGKALALARNGDVDLVLVHAPKAERAFVAAGYGVNRRRVMYNDFVLVGPPSDPAGIRGMASVAAAFGKIARARMRFISRGDDSGTHKKERQIWRATGITPEGPWYLETGQGMGATLNLTDQKDAYTLTDRGTYLAYQGRLESTILVAGDSLLYNPYGVIAVNPARYPHINYLDAMLLIAWMTSVEGQDLIANFRVGGKPLFYPLAVPSNQP